MFLVTNENMGLCLYILNAEYYYCYHKVVWQPNSEVIFADLKALVSQRGTCLSDPCCINNFQNGRLRSNDKSWTRLASCAKSQINTVYSIVFNSHRLTCDIKQNCLRTATLCFDATLWNWLFGGILSTLREGKRTSWSSVNGDKRSVAIFHKGRKIK